MPTYWDVHNEKDQGVKCCPDVVRQMLFVVLILDIF